MADFLGGFDTLLGNSAMPTTGIQDDSVHDYFHKGIGESISKTITLGASGTTASVNVFQLTGTVEIVSLHGYIKTATTLTNCTASSFDLYDGTNTVQITKTDGVLSGFAVGTFFLKNAALGVTMAVADNSQARLTEGASLSKSFAPFFITQKTATGTYVRFTYTTSDAPIAATLLIHARFRDEAHTGLVGTLVAV